MWTNKPIPLVRGINDSIGQGQAPTIHRLLNGRITKEGEIEKRRGFGAMSTVIYDDITNYNGTLPVPSNSVGGVVAPFKHRALLVDSTRVNGEDEDSIQLLTDSVLLEKLNDGWAPRDLASGAGDGFLYPTASGVSTRLQGVGLTDKTHTQTTVCSNEAYTLIAWPDSLIRYTIVDNLTGGTIIDSKVGPSGCTYMMAVADGTANMGIVYIVNNDLKYLDLSDPIVPGDYTLKATAFNTAGVAPLYAAKSHDGSKFVVTYYDTVNGWTAFFSTWAGAVTSTTAYATAGGPECVAIEYDVTSASYVAAVGLGAGANNILTKVLNTSLVDQALNVSFTSSDAARAPIRITLGFNDYLYGSLAFAVPTCYLAWQLQTGGGQVDKVDFVSRYTTTTSTPIAVGTYRYASLCTTMTKYNNQLYVGLGHRSELQGTLFFVNVGIFNTGDRQFAIAGRVGYSLAKGDNLDYSPPVPLMVHAEKLGRAVTGHVFKTKYDTDTTDIYLYEKSSLVFLDFTSAVSYEKVQGTTYIANGSIIKEYSGAGVNEAGFLLSPEMTATNVTFTGAAGSLSAGSYTYRVYYESNYKGKRVRSYAFAFTVTAAANDRAEIVVPSLQWTQRADVAIVVYRTKVNPTATSPFYRVTAYTPVASGTNGWYNNVFNADTVLVRDGLSDANIGDEEYDYLYAGEVAHIAPDTLKCITSYADRLIAASDFALYPSLYFTDRVGVEFSDELAITIPDSGGPIVGLSQVGNSLVIFKNSKIYAISGQGPDNVLSTGLGFSEPYAVSQDIGAVSASAIKRVPGGVAFGSKDGFYLLNDSLQLQFIGKDVYNIYKAESSPKVLNVSYDAVDNAIIFHTGAYQFVYYMLFGAWSIWQYEFPIQCAATANSSVLLADGNIVVAQESRWSDDAYDDAVDAVSYNYIIETDYVQLVDGDQGGLGRLFSIIISGRWFSGATYHVSVAYDQSNEYDTVSGGVMVDSKSYTVPSSPSATASPYDRGKFEHTTTNQRCTSVRVRVSNTDVNRGVAFNQFILRHKNKQRGAVVSPNRTT